MSLTMGSGPFGHSPAGRFNLEIPTTEVLFVDPSPRWIRAARDGETVVDSRRAKLLHRHGALPRYFVPRDDVRWELLDGVEPVEPPAGAPGLDDYVTFPWDTFEAWYEEDEQLIAHAIDPYHRVDVRPTSRHVTLSVRDTVLADTTRARALFETGLPTRWYVPRDDVHAELEPSELQTQCAYKGVASYFSVRAGDELLENIAWTYREPHHDAAPVRELVCFFNEAVDLDLDGERQERPMTPWSRPGWWRTQTRAPEEPQRFDGSGSGAEGTGPPHRGRGPARGARHVNPEDAGPSRSTRGAHRVAPNHGVAQSISPFRGMPPCSEQIRISRR